jgi:hypothetical protein
MDSSQLVDVIAAKVLRRLSEQNLSLDQISPEPSACTLEGQAITVQKVKRAFESGHRTMAIPARSRITPEARDYISEKRISITVINN